MTQRKPRNVTASVHDRLLQLARRRQEDFQAILLKYSQERLLYRLSRSPHRETFILKGALLFALWSDRPHRPTKDLDLLGCGDSSLERLEQLFQDLCHQPVEDDGLAFQASSVRTERIREDEEYAGVRVRCEVRLGNARVQLQVDVGFGDAVTPGAVAVSFPTLLAFPAPALLAYPRETVVAEKFQAMVMLGMGNSRLKDFYDLWVLARQFAFDGSLLCRALQATFRRRQTPLPAELPTALADGFTRSPAKVRQWQAFLRKSQLDAEKVGLEDVVSVLRAFLMPPAQALVRAGPFSMHWPATGPWATSADAAEGASRDRGARKNGA